MVQNFQEEACFILDTMEGNKTVKILNMYCLCTRGGSSHAGAHADHERARRTGSVLPPGGVWESDSDH
jgi:hypothetical protein